MFEEAIRNHYRYPSAMGSLTTEDLWQLPLTTKGRAANVSLNDVAKAIHSRLQQEEEASFVEEASTKSEELTKKLDLVKHVIKVKKEELAEQKNTAARKAEKEQLLEILHGKKVDNMKQLSVEELEAKIQNIG